VDLSTTSLLGSLDTLLVSMLPLPSPLGHVLLLRPLLGVLVRIFRELVARLEDRDGIVPSGLEAGEVGTVSDFIAVLGPVVVVSLWGLAGYPAR